MSPEFFDTTELCVRGYKLAVAMKNRGTDAVPAAAETIERSASTSAKGPRLQRIRAALFLVESISDVNVQVYVAVEADGDVVLTTATTKGSAIYSEEDKNFDEKNAFTFVSPSVLNTVVIFADQWCSWKYSKKVRFGLYTTVDVGKEKVAGRIKSLGLKLPAKSIIELLRANDFSDGRLLPCVKALVIAEYEEQYAKQSGSGYADVIRDWDDDTWKTFFSRVSWIFCAADEAGCESQLLEAIKKCSHYREAHEGRETLISGALIDLLDKKQLAADYADRFVHASDLELLFRRVEQGEVKRVDPTWTQWELLQPPTDQRNIADKLLAVCPTLKALSLGHYRRKTAAALHELDAHVQDKTVLALRYQIYDACEDALLALAADAGALSETQLSVELDKLVAAAVKRVEQRAPEYDYRYRNEPFIRSIILTLFDSCFLSLDGGHHAS